MKINKALIIFFIQFLLISVNCQVINKGPVISINEKSSFAQINKAGDLIKFNGLCSKCSDTIHHGIIHYTMASVVNIKNCRVSFTIIGDTLKTYLLMAISQENSKALMELAFKTFGPPAKSGSDDRKSVYTWDRNLQEEKLFQS